MGLGSFFASTVETKELHSDVKLRSRYYKTNYAKVKAAIIEYATQHKIDVRNIDDEHRELFLQGSRFHIIVSIVQVTPYETSVDFKVEVYRMVGMNKPRKMVMELYAHLDEALTFKGVGLHP